MIFLSGIDEGKVSLYTFCGQVLYNKCHKEVRMGVGLSGVCVFSSFPVSVSESWREVIEKGGREKCG